MILKSIDVCYVLINNLITSKLILEFPAKILLFLCTPRIDVRFAIVDLYLTSIHTLTNFICTYLHQLPTKSNVFIILNIKNIQNSTKKFSLILVKTSKIQK